MTKTQIDQPTHLLVHPETGTLLEPLFTWHGGNVYPVFGGAPEGEDDGASDSEPTTDDTDTDDGEDDSKEGSDSVSRAEFDALTKRLSAADKKRDEAEKLLKKIEDGKKDELTKATERVEELEKQQVASNKELADLRLQNAFLSATTGVTWHDPGDALALAERKGYLDGVVDESGKVDSKVLAAKLKEMAKASPHLVKTEATTGTGSTAPTGAPVGGKGGKKTTNGEPNLSRYDRHLQL